jgi:long-chain acyl-CoA synthetase
MALRVRGREHLSGVCGPVIFAANHESHLDTPAILMSLPRRWRYRTAPVMAKEFFDAYFHPGRAPWRERAIMGLLYHLARGVFDAVPLPQREAGAREALRRMGELAGRGRSILIFPEGQRNPSGQPGAFQPGVGLLAARLKLPVVPVRVDGTGAVLPPTGRRPKRGPVGVTFGAPLDLAGDDYAALARQVEEAVRALPPAGLTHG